MRKSVTGTLFNKIGYGATVFLGIPKKDASLGFTIDISEGFGFYIAVIFAYIAADIYIVKED